jgi:hydroxyproline dehydrogenase
MQNRAFDPYLAAMDRYDGCVASAMAAVEAGEASLFVATHNQRSVERATRRMAQLGLLPGAAPVRFGQLLGMCDHLTFLLASHGHAVRLSSVKPTGCSRSCLAC